MYESPIPYKVDILARDSKDGPLDTRCAVMVAVEMRDGKIIRHFNEDVIKVVEAMKARTPRAWNSGCCPTSPPPSSIASITL
jgi:hypothetical protein